MPYFGLAARNLENNCMNLHLRSFLILLGLSALCAGCGGRAYVYEPVASTQIQDRAESQSDESVRVSAAVPGRDEAEVIFGIALYDQGIQPVWLEIENKGPEQVRYSLVSTDSDYFSPLEVAYTNRSGFSDEARVEMERRLYELAMPRYIDPGETRSGFVFTHADNGAKGFNVDVFSPDDLFNFTFLLRVPGFVPDYANVDFESIYSSDELTVVGEDDLHAAIRNLPCCSADADDDEADAAINLILIGPGEDLLHALLRSRWIETSAAEAAAGEPSNLFGRHQDSIFRHESAVDDSSYEMRLWLAPIVSGEDRVWAVQVKHFYGRRASFWQFDPDVDHARSFALQSFVYGQTVKKLGWVAGTKIYPVNSFWDNLIRPAFFTDGHRSVLWLSGEPFAVSDATAVDWDDPPGQDR
jgi:hypothetical protein